MTLIDNVKKLLNIRIRRLERLNDQLIEAGHPENSSLMHIYFENEARLSELHSILDFINEQEKNK